MAWHPMKPETIARRRREHAEEQARRRRELVEDLRRLAERDGPDSIFAELLEERLAADAAKGER